MENKLLELFEEIHILHLSDLHISVDEHSHCYPASLKKLIDDIMEQVKDYKNIILVVTGDIVDKGNFGKDVINQVVAFFKDLYLAIGEKVIDVEIVPGNHDKSRDNLNTLISKSVQSGEAINTRDDWKFVLNAYNGYFDIHKMILEIFNLKDEKKVENTYGVSTVKLGFKRIIFIRLDSAWCSYSDQDSWQLKIGKYQLDNIVNEYKKTLQDIQEDKNLHVLTIAISHHPLNLLSPNEYEKCNKMFLSEDMLNVDILLCGHVHTASLAHYFNHEHSLLTLVTGIGGSEDRENHRYSIYALNIANNSCDIIMRRSDRTTFNYDYSVYTGKHENNFNKLTYPIRVRDSHTFLEIEAPEIFKIKRMFLDKELLKLIPKVSISLSDFTRNMANKNAIYKNNFIDKYFNEKYNDVSEISDKDEKICDEFCGYFFSTANELSEEAISALKKYYSLEEFFAFLQEICDEIINCIEECFSKDTILRAHFRVYDKTNDEYKSLCVASNESSSIGVNHKPRNLKWNKLIEAAYNRKAPIIYTANAELNETDTAWNDFLTIVPDCSEIDISIIQKVKGKRKTTKRPCLTFGLSIKSNDKMDSSILAILAFLELHEIIKSLIDDYTDIFKFKLNDIINKESKNSKVA